ncbi:hypothetical protein [Pseudoalteromonas tunicata]|jgi:O-antigen/teichoic acid export membrane protein|uniref:Polysaccharide biosynthesis protein n=1 Tax=Pseudoalteromonas tunicata D2 TaxID=87626 RepID=A4CBW4_9GAMM|nr:hypothetical protein [Pseudoalteromonas tunicata]ATC94402.1 hypothetical protein PTUN_a1824 [Pseudoalteromonas tunicata]AXT30140.1 hypothetical protein D1819_04520 [Pseudoalteromonas tunicata]EAR27851.1 hypothetical protein PTD2_18555 [Pseudoalteromonas tunicata D2]
MNFIKKLLSTFIGVGSNAIYQVLLLSLVSKFYTIEELGAYAFFFSISTVVFFFTNVGFRQVIITSSKYNDVAQYLKLRIILSTISFLVLLIFGLIFNPDYILLSVLISFIKFIESVSEIGYAKFQKHQNHNFQSKILFFKSLLSAFLVYSFTKLTFGLNSLLLAISLLHIFIILMYELPKLRVYSKVGLFSEFLTCKKTDLELVKFALPLGVGLFLINLNLNLSRIMSGVFLSDLDTAILAASLQLSLSFAPVITGFTQVLLPKFTYFIKKGLIKKLIFYFISLTLLFSFTSLFMLILTDLYGGVILNFIYNPEIGQYQSIFLICLLAVSFNYISALSNALLTAFEKFKLQRNIMIFCIIINSIMMLLFVDTYGLLALAWSFAFTSLLRMFLLYFYAFSALKNGI